MVTEIKERGIRFGEGLLRKHPSEQPTKEKELTSPPTFTPADTLYFGTLLISSKSRDALKEVGRVLSPDERADIERGVNALEKMGISLDVHLSAKGMHATAKKVASFAKLNTRERQAILENVDGISMIFKPLITLSEEDFGYWHRIAHNDFVRIGDGV